MAMSMEQNGRGDEANQCGADGDFHRPSKKPKLPDNPLRGQTDGIDLINYLPDECLVEIFTHLSSTRDRCLCAAVSKKWLALLATMRRSDFRCCLWNPQANNKTSRCLEGIRANDIALAAMSVGTVAQGGLTKLSIKGGFQTIGDFGLSLVARSCPNLKSLVLWNCHRVGPKGLISVAQCCIDLEKLDIYDSPMITDEGLVAIARNCPNLCMLNLDTCRLIGNQSLQAFATYSSKLGSIGLTNCPGLGAEGIKSIFSSLFKLSKVKLVKVSASNDFLDAIGRQGTPIKTLWLENITGVGGLGFSSIGRFEKLEYLLLKSCSGLNHSSFKAVADGFSRLKHVLIKNCPTMTDKGLKNLTSSAALLESLKLEECNGFTANGLIEAILSCKGGLKVLSLVKCHGIIRGKEDPSKCAKVLPPKRLLLKTLTVDRCSGIGDSFLSWLATTCAQIKHLNLIGLSGVTDSGLLTLLSGLGTSQKALVTVDLSGCVGLTDSSVMGIARTSAEKLRKLKLEGCEGLSDCILKTIGDLCPYLLELDVSKCRISDDGISGLAMLRSLCLEVLSLSGCWSITDKTLTILEMKCGSLVGLNIRNCPKLTSKAIASIREILWWCNVLC